MELAGEGHGFAGEVLGPKGSRSAACVCGWESLPFKPAYSAQEIWQAHADVPANLSDMSVDRLWSYGRGVLLLIDSRSSDDVEDLSAFDERTDDLMDVAVNVFRVLAEHYA